MQSKNVWEKEFYKERTGFREDVFKIPHQDIPKFIDLLREINAQNILDLGCGTGRHVIVLAKSGFSVYGLDIAKKPLQVIKERTKEENLKAELTIANIYERLPYEDNFFDGVISIKVLHHGRVAQIKTLIKELERVMRPGGVLMIEVPKQEKRHSRKKYEKLEPGTFAPLQGPEKGVPHHVFRNEDELRRFFSNFNILDIHSTGKDKVQTPSPHYTVFAKFKNIGAK